MMLTRAERIGRSQLVSGVRRTAWRVRSLAGLKNRTVDLGDRRRVGVPYGWVGGERGAASGEDHRAPNKGTNLTKGGPSGSGAPR